MEKSVELGLFFDRNYIFDPVSLANEIKTKIKEIGEVIILPIDEKNNNPVIIFDKSEEIKLTVFLNSLLIMFKGEFNEQASKNLKKLIDILNKQDINITRIGYIKNIFLGDKEATLFKNHAFDHKELLNSDEFRVSYYKKDIIDNININCWKRYATEYEKFLISIDVNTIKEETHNITYKFCLEFIELANTYIDENQIVKLL